MARRTASSAAAPPRTGRAQASHPPGSERLAGDRRGRRELEKQRVAAERRLVGFAPFDDQDGAVAPALAQAKLGELFGIAEAVEVGVRDGRARLELVDERERRARDAFGAREAEGAAERPREERLAGTEIAAEDHEIARFERSCHGARKANRGAARGQVEDEGCGRHGVRSGSSRRRWRRARGSSRRRSAPSAGCRGPLRAAARVKARPRRRARGPR